MVMVQESTAVVFIGYCDMLLEGIYGELTESKARVVRRIREIACMQHDVTPPECLPTASFKGWLDLLLLGTFGALTCGQRKTLHRMRMMVDAL